MSTITDAGVERSAATRRRRATLLIDGDVHPTYSVETVAPRLSEPARQLVREFGLHARAPHYPRVRNGGGRLDSRADGTPGSAQTLAQTQLLNEYDESWAILIPLSGHHWGAESEDLAVELCHAANEWIREEWLDPEPRFLATLNVPFEHPRRAVEEIERYRGDRRFVQVLLSGQAEAQLGDRKYWPIYEAAADAGMALGVHVGANARQRNGVGFPSFYLEEHVSVHYTLTGLALSMISEGLFEALPKLQVALIEGCISWAAPLQWEMDSAFEVLHRELPHLRAKPSEYFREHFWFTTQPIEEPDDPAQLVEAYEFTGMTDRIMFSSDYPHWDFDSPSRALPPSMPRELRDKILGGNACRLYGIDSGGRR
jgi:uncharacterized protein